MITKIYKTAVLPILLSILTANHSFASQELIGQASYDLTFHIPADTKQHITCTTVITFLLTERADVNLEFQGTLTGTCKVNGRKRDLRQNSNQILLPRKTVRKGVNELILNYICPEEVFKRHPNYIATRIDANKASMCFPVFNQAGLRARFTTHIKANEGWKTMTPHGSSLIPPSLYSMVTGCFEEQTTNRDGRQMRILYQKQEGVQQNAINSLFQEAGHAINWIERYTGIRCPFPEYGIVIMPGYPSIASSQPGVIQLNERYAMLSGKPTANDLKMRKELITHETAHLWFGGIVSMTNPVDIWAEEVLADFLTRRCNMTFRGAPHPIAMMQESLHKSITVHGNAANVKSSIIMEIIEQQIGSRQLQDGLQMFLSTHYCKDASWEDLLRILDKMSPDAGIIQIGRSWIKQTDKPRIHITCKENKLTATQTDPDGKPTCWPQKFDVYLINDTTPCRTITIDMRHPTETIEVNEQPGYIIPNFSGNGYGIFTLDEKYTQLLPQRLLITRNDLNRYVLLLTLYDNYRIGRLPINYFSELYRNMTSEQNPLIMETCLDHMYKLIGDAPEANRRPMEKCIVELLRENRSNDCQRAVIRKMAHHASSYEALDALYKIWKTHDNPLLDDYDYQEIARRLNSMHKNK